MGFLGSLGAGLSSATGIASGIAGIVQGERNYNMQLENYAYQKNLQNTIFNREDNAVQRRVADLKAAGLSPTLAAGSSAGNGAVISTVAPQNQSAKAIKDFDVGLQALNALTMNAQLEKTKADAKASQINAGILKRDYDSMVNHGTNTYSESALSKYTGLFDMVSKIFGLGDSGTLANTMSSSNAIPNLLSKIDSGLVNLDLPFVNLSEKARYRKYIQEMKDLQLDHKTVVSSGKGTSGIAGGGFGGGGGGGW